MEFFKATWSTKQAPFCSLIAVKSDFQPHFSGEIEVGGPKQGQNWGGGLFFSANVGPQGGRELFFGEGYSGGGFAFLSLILQPQIFQLQPWAAEPLTLTIFLTFNYYYY